MQDKTRKEELSWENVAWTLPPSDQTKSPFLILKLRSGLKVADFWGPEGCFFITTLVFYSGRHFPAGSFRLSPMWTTQTAFCWVEFYLDWLFWKVRDQTSIQAWTCKNGWPILRGFTCWPNGLRFFVGPEFWGPEEGSGHPPNQGWEIPLKETQK